MRVIITHNDSDGIISLVIFLKANKNKKYRMFFSTNTRLKDTICASMIGNENLEELCIFDISPSELTLRLASIYQEVLWIDHHKCSIREAPENVKLIIDSDAPSAAQVIANFLKIEDPLVDLANQIDTNNVKSEEASFLRDLIGAIKWKYKGPTRISKLKSIAKTLLRKGVEEFERNESMVRLVNEFREWQEKAVEEGLKRILFFNVEDKKIAIYESTFMVPAYVLTEKLREHEKAPFDIIAMLIHRAQKDKIITKIELRTHTGFDVYKIANFFGGGGHKVASGATFNGFLSAHEFLGRIRQFL